MAEGDRFARGREPSRDADGHSLPSDKSMRIVAVDLVCGGHPVGDEPILARFYIESHFAKFSSTQVNEGTNSAVIERTPLTDGKGHEYWHYKFRCPRCGRSPVVRQGRIDQALELIYEQGAYLKVQRVRL